MSRRSPHRRLIALVLAAPLVGCLTIPDDVRADFDAPDGRRPNNYGRMEADGKTVQPDAPTIGPREAGP